MKYVTQAYLFSLITTTASYKIFTSLTATHVSVLSGSGQPFLCLFFSFQPVVFSWAFVPHLNLHLWWALQDPIAKDQAGLEPRLDIPLFPPGLRPVSLILSWTFKTGPFPGLAVGVREQVPQNRGDYDYP